MGRKEERVCRKFRLKIEKSEMFKREKKSKRGEYSRKRKEN